MYSHIRSYPPNVFVCFSVGFCRGVLTDDLTVLKGCVSRNRALFSPTSSVGKASIQARDFKTTGTWPDLISSPQIKSPTAARYPSPDISSPSEPNLPCLTDMPFSVSIQFSKGRHKDHGNILHSNPVSMSSLPINHKRHCECSTSTNKARCFDMANSKSIPSGLNSSLKSYNIKDPLSQSRSCVSEKLDQHHLLNVPFGRTNSLDSQKPATSHYNQANGKGTA